MDACGSLVSAVTGRHTCHIYCRVVHYGMTSAYIQGLLQLAKHERYTYPSLKTVMLTGQLFSLQLRQDLAKYFGALPYVSWV